MSLEDVGKDLQVVAVGSADLETPGGDVVVALDEHADLALAGLQAGVELAVGDLEGGCHLLGHVLEVETGGIAALAFVEALGFEVFGGAAGDHVAGLAQDLQ